MAKKTTTAPRKAAPRKAKKVVLETEEQLYDLTPEEVRSLVTPRVGFEGHVGPMLQLYEDEPEELRVRTVDADEVRAEFASYQALASYEAKVAKHLEMVQETRRLRAAHVWSAVLEIYAKGQTAARTNPDIARAIADFASFMKLGPRKKPEGK